MSITFQCLCGKRLKAQESSAGKRTRCPRCGEPVGIPLPSAPAGEPVSRKEAAAAAARKTPAAASQRPPAAEASSPTQSGSTIPVPASQTGAGSSPLPYFMIDDGPAPPVTVKQRRPGKSPHRQTASASTGQVLPPAADPASQQLDESLPEGITLRKRPRWHRLISRGGYRGPSFADGTGDTVRSAVLVVAMAAGLTLTLSIAAVTLPGAMQNAGDATGLLAGAGAGFLLTLVYTCSYLHQITVNAARPAGESISLNPILAARTGGGWAAAVLSGPVLPAAGSYLYWLRIGLKDAVDWIILAELIWLTVFWLTAALLSVAIDSDWKSALPHRALRKARLIPKSIAIHSAVSAVLCAGTVFGITHSLVTIHTDGFSGIVCMGGTFLTCLLASAALARSLGRTGTSILPEDTAEVDAGIQAFEQELQSSQI